MRLVAAVVAAGLLAAACTSTGAGRPAAPRPPASPSAPAHAPEAATTRAPRVTAPGPPTATLALTGDLLVHAPVAARARREAHGTGYDFRPGFARVRPVLSAADLAVCHLETPVSRTDADLSYYPSFSVPREIVPAIRWAGYDTCTTASNHTVDRGLDGIRSTLAALDAAGLRHVGAARSAAEAARHVIYDVHGIRIGHLDYTYGLNGQSLPAGAPWAVRLIDPDRILRDAAAIRRSGAQFVLVSLHWGEQYQAAPTADQRSLARRLLASPDVDLIVGNHAHVVQPVERIGGKYVVYGDGNFLARHATCCDTPHTRDGVIVQVTVTGTGSGPRVTRLTYTPTYVDPATVTILPVARALADPGTPPALRAVLQESWRRTTATMGALGAARYGVLPTRP